ncbi:MAG TPA: NUDIX domain-containing protein [Candidatus Dormibacteraeota bacterium]|nr:NUDIX domain-containing protein [Candidatus Dormibacteraeota bacterium]
MVPERRERLRVSAYAVVVRDGMVLLARYVDFPPPRWTLPGGGVEHGEDPADAVLRELTEETGYTGRVVRLLGIHSARYDFDRDYGVEDQHALRIVYEVALTGGELRHEVGGTTDMAGWHSLDGLARLERARLVDIGLSMPDSG